MSEQGELDFSGPVGGAVAGGLPKGWVQASVQALASLSPRSIQSGPFGSNLRHSEFRPTGRLVIGIDNVQDGHFSMGSRNRISVAKFAELERYRARPLDVLITVMATVGRCCVVPANIEPAIITKHVYRITPELSVVAPSFLMFALKGAPAVRNQMYQEARGQTRLGLNGTIVKGLQIPVPPLPEQHRIVAEIEKHFTRLDDAVATLKRVQAQLKRARASVLKAAVEGRLVPTEAELARAEGRSYEPASVLLERILEERRKRHEEAQVGAKRKKKYKEPVGPETQGLPELPAGWAWASVEQMSDATRTVTYGVVKLGAEVPDGIPTLRSSNVRPLRLEIERVKRISPSIEANYRRTRLVGGELLITVRGTLGGVVVAPDSCADWNVSREVAVIALQELRLGPFIAVAFGSPVVSNWMKRRLKGITYTGLNIATLKEVPLPLPPQAEQHRIVAEVERRLSVIDALEQTVERNLARSSRLRQSILKRAFEGKLVPQDPNDEPASELLARIRAERETGR